MSIFSLNWRIRKTYWHLSSSTAATGANRAAGIALRLQPTTTSMRSRHGWRAFSIPRTPSTTIGKEAARLLLWSISNQQATVIVDTLRHAGLSTVSIWPAAGILMGTDVIRTRRSRVASVRRSTLPYQSTSSLGHPKCAILLAGQCRLSGRQSVVAFATARPQRANQGAGQCTGREDA